MWRLPLRTGTPLTRVAHLSHTCSTPAEVYLYTGTPLTTMYASPIVSTCCDKHIVSQPGDKLSELGNGTFGFGQWTVFFLLVFWPQPILLSKYWHGKQAQSSRKLMTTVSLKLMITVCHLFPSSWVCNRNKWVFLLKVLFVPASFGRGSGNEPTYVCRFFGNESKNVEKHWICRLYTDDILRNAAEL